MHPTTPPEPPLGLGTPEQCVDTYVFYEKTDLGIPARFITQSTINIKLFHFFLSQPLIVANTRLVDWSITKAL